IRQVWLEVALAIAQSEPSIEQADGGTAREAKHAQRPRGETRDLGPTGHDQRPGNSRPAGVGRRSAAGAWAGGRGRARLDGQEPQERQTNNDVLHSEPFEKPDGVYSPSRTEVST